MAMPSRWNNPWVAAASTWMITAAAPAQVPGPDDAAAEAVVAEPAGEYAPGEILIKFVDQAPQSAMTAAAQRVGGQVLREFPAIGVRLWRLGAGVTVEQALAALRRPPVAAAIEYAEPNYILRADDFPADPLAVELWGMHNIGQAGGTPDADIDAPEAWDIHTGSASVVVGVIDSGIDYTHADLAPNIWSNLGEVAGDGIDNDGNGYIDDVRGWDFVSDDNDPMDDNGHGTHVAGTIGAVGDNGIGVAGVSWTVTLMPLKFLNAGGNGSTADAVDAILYSASFEDASGGKTVRITSNSWGGGQRSNALEDAIAASGALFVAAAGNNGSSQKHYPAAYSLANIISVASTDDDDLLAGSSNYSASWVDLGAPGVGILSADVGNSYVFRSGTSMATPHVSGAAALVMAGFPGLLNDEVKAQILGTVDPLPSLAGKTLTGGRLNAAAALGGSPDTNPPDTTPPAQVTDLAAVSSATTYDSTTLTWTAPGDDATAGTAFLYDVRYSTSLIADNAGFAAATQAAGEPQPQPPGSAETFAIGELTGDTTYYLAVKAADDAGNYSALSNIVAETTLAPPPSAWTTETVDSAGDVGFYHALAFDPSDDNPSIAYSDNTNGKVKYAHWNGSSWQALVIDNGGPGIDVGFDPITGLPAVSHGWGKLRFVSFNGSTWSVQILENSGATNDVTSLAYDGLGNPAISYTKGGLKLARFNGSSWTKVTVESGAGARYSSLAFDPADGNPSIAYSDDPDGDGWLSALKFAHWNGAAWQIQVVESGVQGFGVFANLAFDLGTGYPAIAHQGGSGLRARIARFDGSQWVIDQFDFDGGTFAGAGASLVFDAFGTPFVGSQSSGEVRLSIWDGLAWLTEVVDPATDSTWRTSLKIAPDGTLAMSYLDWDNYDLKFARRMGP